MGKYGDEHYDTFEESWRAFIGNENCRKHLTKAELEDVKEYFRNSRIEQRYGKRK